MNQTGDEYHNPAKAVCDGFFKFVFAVAIVQAREVSPCLNVQINCSNYWPFHYAHYDVLASCIS
jgi:hypothetical protein